MSEDDNHYTSWGMQYVIVLELVAQAIGSGHLDPEKFHQGILKDMKKILGVTPTNEHVTAEELAQFGNGLSKEKMGHAIMCPLCRDSLPAALNRPPDEVKQIIEAVFDRLQGGTVQ